MFSIETTLTPGKDFFSYINGESLLDTTIRCSWVACFFFLPRNRDLPDGTLTYAGETFKILPNPNDSNAFLIPVFVISPNHYETTIGNAEIFQHCDLRFSLCLIRCCRTEHKSKLLFLLFIFL
jgi:hypothetical protein